MIVEVVKQNQLTAVSLRTRDCAFVAKGRRVLFVLAFGSGSKRMQKWLWVVLNHERAVFRMRVLKVQLKNIIIGW